MKGPEGGQNGWSIVWRGPLSPHDLCGRHFGVCGLLGHRLAPCADELQPCGFCFLLFDAVVTEAQRAGYRRPGSFS